MAFGNMERKVILSRSWQREEWILKTFFLSLNLPSSLKRSDRKQMTSRPFQGLPNFHLKEKVFQELPVSPMKERFSQKMLHSCKREKLSLSFLKRGGFPFPTWGCFFYRQGSNW